MAILQSKPQAKTQNLEGIPPMLDRRNGEAKPDVEALLAKIAELEAKVAAKTTIKLKVSDKAKALSIYGLQKFPITLFAGQWQRVLEHKDEILAFIEDHKGELSWK